MASYLQAENLSKSYGPRVLFKDISFNINEGEKIALIAPNGTGKSSLLKIIAGIDSSDTGGSVKFMKEIKVIYLEQNPQFEKEKSVFEAVFNSAGGLSEVIKEYEEALESHDTARIEKAIHLMDQTDAWQYETKVKQVLSNLRIDNLNQKVGELSGGQIKRIALAGVILSESDLIILDEPTNHLDLDVIEYLEEYLKRASCTLLMVTHDRYFLDRICTEILEMDNGKLYSYKGNYSYFLEKRDERIQNFNSETEKARNLLRTELDWMRRMPQARATKAKYRIDAFYELQERASQSHNEKSVKINVGTSRLGKKIIHCKSLTHKYGDYCTVNDFTYNFSRFEKIGIVGANGAGKSTFLNLLTGAIAPTSGTVDCGETIKFGYYTQKGLDFQPGQKVIEILQEIAEYVTLADGSTMSVGSFLNYFLFPPATHYTQVEKLSGGELRRLYLVSVLMSNPNFLILDEPTNDLDIMTLNVLEEYLKNFGGCLLIVSHDRYFLDKIADHIFVFKGDGLIKDFPGSYSDYREFALLEEKVQKEAKDSQKRNEAKVKENTNQAVASNDKPKKLSYKEQKELEQLSAEIETLTAEKDKLEAELSSGTLAADKLMEASNRIGEIMELLDDKELRWLELSC